MSLASSLLKHLAITKLYNVPWSKSTISRDGNGKPCYLPKTIDFNVSHQAGLVTLVAGSFDLGTDIVCVNERDDLGRIEKDGLFTWVDMHAEVFSPREIQYIKLDPSNLGLEHLDLSGYGRDAVARCQYRNQKAEWTSNGASHTIESNLIVDAKLRRFYAAWCLREAYVKMTGEALLAEWLQRLEFRNFRSPKPKDNVHGSSLEVGEIMDRFDIHFKGKKVEDVVIELRAIGQDFMIATSARCPPNIKSIEFPGFTKLDIEKDIYLVAGQ
jgi:4'-phosphopantetheinyl transferase